MKLDTILDSLLAAATALKEPLQETASQSLKDAYHAAKTYLLKKLSDNSADALKQTVGQSYGDAPEAEHLASAKLAGCEDDAELHRLIEELNSVVEKVRTTSAAIHIGGSRNHVQYAGRDLIVRTERAVRRNIVSPDERHLAGPQLEAVRRLIKEVAARVGGSDGEINHAAVHRMLQRRLGVASYLLIPRERAEEALSYLRQQRAILRPRVRNNAVRQNDLFRSIFAGAREMNWDRLQVYLFAAETLQLKQPLQSLKQLSESQLKQLCQSVRGEVGRYRAKEYAQSCASQKDTF